MSHILPILAAGRKVYETTSNTSPLPWQKREASSSGTAVKTAETSVKAQADMTEEEKKKARKGAAGRKTLLTGPGGVTEAAPVGRKTLLGQ